MKRTVLIALGSFLLGVIGTLVVVARPSVFAQDSGLNNGFMPIVPALGSALPVVPPLAHIHFGHNTVLDAASASTPMVIHLDGLEQTGNIYGGNSGVQIVYGGGAYKLEDNTFIGPISLELTGAAANTVDLLKSFGLLPPTDPPFVIPNAAPPKDKDKPRVIKTRLKTPFKGNIFSGFPSQ